jgi:hypothetical protein
MFVGIAGKLGHKSCSRATAAKLYFSQSMFSLQVFTSLN